MTRIQFTMKFAATFAFFCVVVYAAPVPSDVEGVGARPSILSKRELFL